MDQAATELIETCKQTWNRVAVFALLCPRWEQPLGNFSGLLARVDDFLSCPFQDAELLLRLERLLRARGITNSLAGEAAREHMYFESPVGNSENFFRVASKIAPLAQSNITVLLSGETGTGKELFARAIHYRGPRHGKPFIPVNCATLPEHLFESELFGHVKGAFTDASSTEKGLLGEAEGGTLFLDEIDALSHAGQVKLLRFLQDGEYRPVGSARTIMSDVRVIAATNTDLKKGVDAKLFRDDLYYRLNFLALTIPPLRERIDDIIPLTRHLLERHAKQHGQQIRALSFHAIEKLMAYPWPGNVRELESVIARALTFSQAATLESDDIDLPSIGDDRSLRGRSLRDEKLKLVQGFERNYLASLLAKYHGNITRAAKAAGKERRTFQRLLKRHNLDRRSYIPS
jgi:DNA-binding NtrC family response regulator